MEKEKNHMMPTSSSTRPTPCSPPPACRPAGEMLSVSINIVHLPGLAHFRAPARATFMTTTCSNGFESPFFGRDFGTEANWRFSLNLSQSKRLNTLDILQMPAPLVIIAHGAEIPFFGIDLSDYYKDSKYMIPCVAFLGPEGYELASTAAMDIHLTNETIEGLYAYKPKEIVGTADDTLTGIYPKDCKKVGNLPNYALGGDYVPSAVTVCRYPDTFEGKVNRFFQRTQHAISSRKTTYKEGPTTESERLLQIEKFRRIRSGKCDFDILMVKEGATSLKNILDTLHKLKIRYPSIRLSCCRGDLRTTAGSLVHFDERLGRQNKGLVTPAVMRKRVLQDPGLYAEKLNRLQCLYDLIKTHANLCKGDHLEFLMKNGLEYLNLAENLTESQQTTDHLSQFLEVVTEIGDRLRAKAELLKDQCPSDGLIIQELDYTSILIPIFEMKLAEEKFEHKNLSYRACIVALKEIIDHVSQAMELYAEILNRS